MSPLSRLTSLLGPLAALSLFVAVGNAVFALPGFSFVRHPLALLGAVGTPGAAMFNVLAWCLPGLLSVLLVVVLQRQLGGQGALARVGLHMVLLGALAFAALGVFPLQIEALDGPRSQLHASLWMVWALACMAGSLLLACGLWQVPAQAALARLSGCTAIAIAVGGFALPSVLPAPLAQLMAFLAWLTWVVLALPLARLR